EGEGSAGSAMDDAIRKERALYLIPGGECGARTAIAAGPAPRPARAHAIFGAFRSRLMTDSPNVAGDTRRFRLIPPEALTPEQRVLADAIRSGPRAAVKNSAAAAAGPLGGPFNVWLRSPDIGDLIQRLGEAIRFRSSL